MMRRHLREQDLPGNLETPVVEMEDIEATEETESEEEIEEQINPNESESSDIPEEVVELGEDVDFTSFVVYY